MCQLMHEQETHTLGMHVLVEHYVGTFIDSSAQSGKVSVSFMQTDKNSLVFQKLYQIANWSFL